jgi:MFS transporter, PAT family, beta-lactamase induction signal transducer AmpG
MVYLLYVARGEHPTAHYALCSGAMALGLMLAGYVAAGALDWFGGNYVGFFTWIVVCSLVSFATLWRLPLEESFGQRVKEVHHEGHEEREG